MTVEAHEEEERSMTHQHGAGRRTIEADVEEERAPVDVWWLNDRVRV
jgi:hypothetical protein